MCTAENSHVYANKMSQRLRAPSEEEAEKLREGVFMISSILSSGSAPGPSQSSQPQREGTYLHCKEHVSGKVSLVLSAPPVLN